MSCKDEAQGRKSKKGQQLKKMKFLQVIVVFVLGLSMMAYGSLIRG